MAKPTRTVKVFCSDEERDALAAAYSVVQKYESFLLLKVSAAEAKRLAKKYPTEDISAQYTLQVGRRKINTNSARVDADGITRAHAAYRGIKRLSKGNHHYLVQFIGPIKENWLRRLKRLGAEPREPFAHFAYIVRCSEKTLAAVAGQPYVHWVGHLSHKDRVQITDARRPLPRTKVLQQHYTVEFFGREDLRKARAPVRKLGIKIVAFDEKACLMTVLIDKPSKTQALLLDQLSAVHGVRAIRRRAFKRTSNDVAGGILQAHQAQRNPLNLTGTGEIVCVCDTGLDTGETSSIHEDFRGRIQAIRSYPIPHYLSAYIRNPEGDDGPADLDSGHGTHVAGSALGSGAASRGLSGQNHPVRGLAHEAILVFQAVEQELQWKNMDDEIRYGRYLLVGIPDNLTELFQFAYQQGARIHSNSWGGGAPGEYDAQCRQLDAFVWHRKDFCILVAAGNDGTDQDGDGRINPMSVTSPATAKNCITVGACESFRPQFNSETYGEWWPQDYPVSPYRNAAMANSPNQVVAFSSRGPCEDGRVKPDVVAPGTFILSTRSRKIPLSHTGWAPFPPSRHYFYMGGTSMATPLVAGAAALLRQFLREWVGFKSPSAALVKACLVLGATKLSGYSGAADVHDHAQGYGRVHLDAVVTPPAPTQVYFLDDAIGLRTGQLDEFTLQVRSNKIPLRVAMAYSDYPGRALVNNLNLQLVDDRGRYHVGNGRAGDPLAGDSLNNVEVIHIKRPHPGSWRLRIVASNAPQGPQDYAFALSGHVTACEAVG